MKTCQKCHTEKDDSAFSKHPHTADGLEVTCRSCKSANTSRLARERGESYPGGYSAMLRDKWAEYYSKPENKKKVVSRVKSRADSRKAALDSAKSSRGCLRCGESDASCLDFHHVADKSFSISRRNSSDASLSAEISKCVVLCSNCHRKLHAELWSLLDFSAKIESDYPEAFDMLYKSVHPYH